MTERWLGRLGYKFDWRRAFDGDVFDTAGHGLFASTEYVLTSSVRFYGRYDARVGGVVSTASPNARLLAASDAVEVDDGVWSTGCRGSSRAAAWARL